MLHPALAVTLSLALALPQTAAAFCGFYVARAEGDLFNRSSTVVYARINTRSTITMGSDYRGPAAEFAMIVPTPGVLRRADVRTVRPDTVAHLDAYTAPRLVEYFDPDPCEPVMEMVMAAPAAGGADGGGRSRRDGARALGVTILAEFPVGIYDITMLSAQQSDGLIAFLRGEGYRLPDGAETAVQGYIGMGMKFFVAKVNLDRHEAGATQQLEPLQITFQSADFMLPIQLGKVNGDGPQDLIVMTLTRKGRVELANYPVRRLPTDEPVPALVEGRFGDFYRAVFDRVAPESGAVLEYAWDMAWCDPCAADPLSYEELRELGVSWVARRDAQTPEVFATRLHVRYGPGNFAEDLMFRETADRENFQGRYVIRHPFEGEITCPEAADYVPETRKRLREEVRNLLALTGWRAAEVEADFARSVPAQYR